MTRVKYVPCQNCGEKYNPREGKKDIKYCGKCRQITEIWLISENGRIKQLSEEETTKFDEMREEDKLFGTYFLNWPFAEDSEPELHQCDGDSFEYLSARPVELRAALRIFRLIKRRRGRGKG